MIFLRALHVLAFSFLLAAVNSQVVGPSSLCDVYADIVFVLDSSTSPRYHEMLLFVNNIVNNIKESPNGAMYSALTYSDSVHNLFYINNVSSTGQISQKILSAPQQGSGQALDQALTFALKNSLDAKNGARSNASKLVIVLASDKSSDASATQLAAQLIKDTGATLIAVGFGATDNPELDLIASDPSLVFKATGPIPLDTFLFPIFKQICAVRTANCDAQADILLIMDSTGSIGPVDYDKMLKFVANLTHSFTLGPKNIQFGAILFGDDAQNLFDFGAHNDHASLENAIRTAPYLAQTTYTNLALKYARLQSYTALHGARPGITRIAIVLTDGGSYDPNETAREAQLLKDTGVLVLSIGIGTNINQTELRLIASSPADVFQVNNFDILNTISKQVANVTCQEAEAPPKQTCDAEADILFIMDSSGSILQNNYNTMLRFVANITRNFNVGPNAIQFSSIIFGDDARIVFDFKKYTDQKALEAGILQTPYLQQNTYTNEALALARNEAFTAVRGSRPNVPHIAIVLTDGQSSAPSQTTTEAQLLKNSGVKVVSIGIGNTVLKSELDTIASFPSDVFTVSTFDVLSKIQEELINKTCGIVVAPSEPNPTCSVSAKADILFILDSSGSILTDNYKKMLNFVVDLTRNFKFGPNEIQFASIIFGDDAEEIFDFKNYTSQSSLEKGILAIPYLMGWTYTDRALLMARQMFTPAKGSRSNVPKIAIVFTDGQSNDPPGTQQQAKLLKDSGVLVLSIGIGNSVNQQELESIASKAEDVFQVTNFDVLDTIQKQVTNITCISAEPSFACDVEADILFIMDSSGSIKIDNYNKMLNFVVNLTKNFNIGPSAIQFANVIFSDNAEEVFDFDQFTDRTALEAAILKTPYLQGGTYTNEALELARLQMFTAAKGSRPGVPKIAIVFTDGQSTDRSTTAEQARLLKSSKVLVLSIGIGSGVNNQELLTIASLPEDVFQVTNFDVLSTIQKQVTNKTCEKVTTPPPACEAQADILFVMDSSGSILAGNYNKMLNFVVNLTRSFKVGQNAVQFGNVIFSDNAREIFDFRKYSNNIDLEKGILGTPYLLGATYTNKALQLAREQMFTAAKGSRPDVPKIVIVLTDGQSTNGLETANQARLLKNTGVLVLSIGIGNGVNKQELQTIASLPQDVFQVTNFDVLDTIQKQVTNQTCERVMEEKPECPAVADILFILDSTGSIGESNYKTLLKFIANFTRNFGIGTNWVQFSALSFADTAHTDFRFNTYTTHTDLEKGILNSTYFGQTTQTDLALKLAREQSFTAANGARPNVDKIVIVFTDGRSNDPGLTAAQAKLLKDSGVLVLTVAIGVDILNRELEAIATLPEDVFHVENFNSLESIEKEFASQACERVTQNIQCAAHADILFILDSSGSIGTVNYPKMLNFVANLTKNFDLGPNAVQFSTIVFGDDAHLEFDFGKYNNHPSLEQAILGIRYLAQNTFTNKALLLARLQAFTAASGARNSATKIAIVLTDGQSSLPTETTREANLLKDAGVLVLSIGIGDVVKESELEAIASLPQDVFKVNSFDVLNTIQKAVTNRTCENVSGGRQKGCSKLADIIFLVDSSGSESDQSYKQQLLFAANFTDNYHIGVNAARFGAVIFSDKATKLFDLDDYGDHWSILQSLMAAPHLLGGTNTAGALDMIYNQGLFGVPAGGRDNATKMLIIMTDGQSANITQSVAAAQQLKNAGIQILTIGVGDIVNVAELQSLASGPGDYFQAASYEVLHQLQEEVTNHTCGYVTHLDTAIQHACSEMADIIFVMDSSDTITPEDYEKQLLFASNLTQEFDVGPVDARFASVVFSNDVFKVFDLGDFSDHLGIYNGLLKSPHLTGTTDVGKALNWVNDMNMFGSANGGRNNASKIIVLFVDNPSVDQAASIHAADRLKRDGVQITTVGVNDYDLYELRQIASSPSSAFKATSVDSLSWIERSIVDNICDFASTHSTSP